MTTIDFIDLKTQHALIKDGIKEAIERVLSHGQYILGPEVSELEKKLAEFCGAKFAISCANGTDALMLILMAKGIQPGDCVILPAFTFAATAGAVAKMGAKVVFVDVEPDTFNIDIDSLKAAIKTLKDLGLQAKALISVDLFGQPANYDEILNIVDQNKMWLLSDAAQSFGATYKGKKVGTFGAATSTSFFPAKPFGCYGDGGCIFTDDEELNNILRSLRMHGQGSHKYETVRVGFNSRLDTLQAAILLEKLKIFPQEIQKRQTAADRYNEVLGNSVHTPFVTDNVQSVWAQYTVKLQNAKQREDVQAKLKDAGIPSVIYYPAPLHHQTAFKNCLRATPTLPNSELLSSVVLSLPMSPYVNFSNDYIEKITKAFK